MDTLSIVMLVWYGLTALSLVYLVYDFSTNTPLLWLMKLAWVLIILYTGPVGIVLYILSCRKPAGTTHTEFIKDHWKQSVGSMIHCIAGDATGIIIAAIIAYNLSVPNGIDLILEYVGGFVVGLLVFQALFMLNMYGNYWVAVKKTFFAETVSMNMVMVGMFPTMIILKHLWPQGDSPLDPTFWFIMSLSTLAAGVTAYPINSWMVGRGIKHGMMSAPEPGAMKMEGHEGMAGHGHEGHDMGGMKHEGHAGHAGHDMAGMSHGGGEHAGHGMDQGSHGAGHDGHDMAAMGHGSHGGGHEAHAGGHGSHGRGISFGLQVAVMIGTLAFLIAVMVVVAQFVPIRFS